MLRQAVVKVWDPLVRLFHWTLAAAFAVAYLSGGEPIGLHTVAGYVVAGVVLARILWGLVGTRHARFSDFLYRPSTVLAYLRDVLRLRPQRYLGHNPVGGLMVVLLLFSLSMTTATGLVAYGGEGGGPLAAYLASAPAAQPAQPALMHVDDEHEEHGEREGGPGEGVEELHEFFATVTLALVFMHIAGVLVESLLQRENLVRAMISGRKRIDE